MFTRFCLEWKCIERSIVLHDFTVELEVLHFSTTKASIDCKTKKSTRSSSSLWVHRRKPTTATASRRHEAVAPAKTLIAFWYNARNNKLFPSSFEELHDDTMHEWSRSLASQQWSSLRADKKRKNENETNLCRQSEIKHPRAGLLHCDEWKRFMSVIRHWPSSDICFIESFSTLLYDRKSFFTLVKSFLVC